MKVAHIGLPKCASTFLQLTYLSKLTEDFYSTQPPFKWPKELRFVYSMNMEVEQYYQSVNWVNNKITSIGKEKLNIRLDKIYQTYRKQVAIFADITRNKNELLISSEGLYGINKHVNKLQMRLLKEASIGKIILIIRNQVDWMNSFWKQLIIKEDRFYMQIKPENIFCFDYNDLGFESNWLDYVKNIYSIYKKEEVLVIPYELLINNPNEFFNEINKFIGIRHDFIPDYLERINVSKKQNIYSGTKIDMLPFTQKNIFIRKLARKVMNLDPKLKGLLERTEDLNYLNEMDRQIEGIFSEKNKRLGKLIGRDLSRFNYY